MILPIKYHYLISCMNLCIHAFNVGQSPDIYRQGPIGAVPSSIRKHPYLVSFRHKQDIVGAGAIIKKSWILTTSNNVFLYEATDLEVRAGSDFANKSGQLIKVKNIIRHPDNDGSWKSDIALVQLEKDIMLNNDAATIEIRDKVPEVNGTLTTVCGWGYKSDDDNDLRVVEDTYPILDTTSCKSFFERPKRRGFTNTSICTLKYGHIPCLYDDGVPLVHDHTLIGLYSGTMDCLEAIHPAIYSDVPLFKTWVSDTIKNYTLHFERG